MEGIEDRLHVPCEHPTIPEEFPTLVEDLRHLDVGLFRKGLYLHKVLILTVRELDIAIARLRTRGAYAESNQLGMRLHIVQRAADSFVESILLQDQVVSRSDQDICIGILRVDVICRPADTRSCIAAHRL